MAASAGFRSLPAILLLRCDAASPRRGHGGGAVSALVPLVLLSLLVSSLVKEGASQASNFPVTKDGVIKYPLVANQTLHGIWKIQGAARGYGPSVEAANGNMLHYFVDEQADYNKWLYVTINKSVDTTRGALLRFRVRANNITSSEVKFTLPCEVILRFTGGGKECNWQRFGSGLHFINLAPSTVRPDGLWHDIVMAFSPREVTVFEDGKRAFTWATSKVGTSFKPVFHMQVLDWYSSLSFDVADIYVIPSLSSPDAGIPWLFGARKGTDGLDAYFHGSFARVRAQPLKAWNSWTYLDVAPVANPPTLVLCYPLRIGKLEGSETKITLPGDNILRFVQGGSEVNWQEWREWGFNTLAKSGIRVGATNFTTVTLVVSNRTVVLLENGKFLYQRQYPQNLTQVLPQGFDPTVAVQHADVGTELSVDIGGIRVVPW